MAATILGFQENEVKAQPALDLIRSENGAWTAKHLLTFKASDFAAIFPLLKKGTLLSSLDPTIPEPFDGFLIIDTISIARVEGDLYEVSINAFGSGISQFEGEEGDLNTEAIPTYTLQGNINDSPLTEHRKFKKLPEDQQLTWYYQKYLDNYRSDEEGMYDTLQAWFDQRGYFRVKNVAPENIVNGVSETVSDFQFAETTDPTFKKCVYTWTEETEGVLELTPAQLNKLGKISTPRGNPPTPNEDRNWMLTSVSQTQSGTVYKTTLEWTLSDVGKHDEFLYS